MLRKFKITVDGTQYLVEMEEVGAPEPSPADAARQPAAPAPGPQKMPSAAPASPAQPAPPVAGSGTPHEAPMPGTILDIHVQVGQHVTTNQPVMVLEAMKMESEIVAEKDGVVTAINVAKGDMVNPGDVLFCID